MAATPMNRALRKGVIMWHILKTVGPRSRGLRSILASKSVYAVFLPANQEIAVMKRTSNAT
jgi:hypothetical protein